MAHEPGQTMFRNRHSLRSSVYRFHDKQWQSSTPATLNVISFSPLPKTVSFPFQTPDPPLESPSLVTCCPVGLSCLSLSFRLSPVKPSYHTTANSWNSKLPRASNNSGRGDKYSGIPLTIYPQNSTYPPDESALSVDIQEVSVSL